MTPAQIRAARLRLGLTQAQMAGLLETAPRHYRSFESDPATSTHREPPPRAVQLIQAYLDGFRPDAWPIT